MQSAAFSISGSLTISPGLSIARRRIEAFVSHVSSLRQPTVARIQVFLCQNLWLTSERPCNKYTLIGEGYHSTAITRADEFQSIQESTRVDIRRRMDLSLAERVSKNRERVLSIVKILILCGRQNIPIRGHRDHLRDVEADAVANHSQTKKFKKETKNYVLAKLLYFHFTSQALRNCTISYSIRRPTYFPSNWAINKMNTPLNFCLDTPLWCVQLWPPWWTSEQKYTSGGWTDVRDWSGFWLLTLNYSMLLHAITPCSPRGDTSSVWTSLFGSSIRLHFNLFPGALEGFYASLVVTRLFSNVAPS